MATENLVYCLLACKLGQWDLVNLLLFYNADVNVGPKPEDKKKEKKEDTKAEEKNQKEDGRSKVEEDEDEINQEVSKLLYFNNTRHQSSEGKISLHPTSVMCGV